MEDTPDSRVALERCARDAEAAARTRVRSLTPGTLPQAIGAAVACAANHDELRGHEKKQAVMLTLERLFATSDFFKDHEALVASLCVGMIDEVVAVRNGALSLRRPDAGCGWSEIQACVRGGCARARALRS